MVSKKYIGQAARNRPDGKGAAIYVAIAGRSRPVARHSRSLCASRSCWPRQKGQSENSIASIVEVTLHTQPKGMTRWSFPLMAAEQDVSKSTINNIIWQSHNLNPHRRGQPSREADGGASTRRAKFRRSMARSRACQ